MPLSCGHWIGGGSNGHLIHVGLLRRPKFFFSLSLPWIYLIWSLVIGDEDTIIRLSSSFLFFKDHFVNLRNIICNSKVCDLILVVSTSHTILTIGSHQHLSTLDIVVNHVDYYFEFHNQSWVSKVERGQSEDTSPPPPPKWIHRPPYCVNYWNPSQRYV